MSISVNLIKNSSPLSGEIYDILKNKLEIADFTVNEEFQDDADLIISIGGDGIFLELVQTYGFPKIPIVGINTGHLGFFQEIEPDDIDSFIEQYMKGSYTVQKLTTVKATVITDTGSFTHRGLNDIVIRGASTTHVVHLDIAIGNSFIEKFSGDGIVISTPSGSTAYSYSLSGSIVDPRIRAMQVTPIAPMNTTAYRSFTSSILLPMDVPISIKPQDSRKNSLFIVGYDSSEAFYSNIKEIKVELSNKVVSLIRFDNYNFWNKVMTKFL